jgi:hypothetical protein
MTRTANTDPILMIPVAPKDLPVADKIRIPTRCNHLLRLPGWW